MEPKKTLVLGASENPDRYSNKAIYRLIRNGHPVVAVGNKKGKVQNVEITTEKMEADDIDTVTLYLNPTNQKPYYDYILSLNPKRIIFNPGTENPELEQMAQQQGISVVEGCTLVMLGIGNY